ncbi:MAG: signal peptidase II [Alistipes indistinctus]
MGQNKHGPSTRVLRFSRIGFLSALSKIPGPRSDFSSGGSYGKLILSVFRLAAIAALGYYLAVLLRKKAHPRACSVGFTLIFAGAVGNVIDRVRFYGLLFSESTFTGVAIFSSRREADMPVSCTARWLTCFISRSLAECTPVGSPWVGGEPFLFFSPIFNLADSYISVGIIYMLLENSSANFSNKFPARKANFQKGGIRVVKGFPKAPAYNLPPRCHCIR